MVAVDEIVLSLGRLAKNASYKLSTLSTEQKNHALHAIAASIDEHRSMIKAENQLDLRAAADENLSQALVDRLMLNDKRIDDMIAGIKFIAELPDPVGKLITSRTLENGLDLRKVRVPIGVIGIIFESRPNVVTDVAALCLKSGNAVILRGGKEAEHSNRIIMKAIDNALQKIEFVPFAVQMIPVADRAAVTKLCKLDHLVDLIIPRGGEGLIRAVSTESTVPVIKHYKGVCHIYIDDKADQAMALPICHNAKVQKPSACNAVETILVHERIAETFLPKLAQMFATSNVELRGDERARAIVPTMSLANERDWSEEYLDLIVSVKVVNGLSDAINHINYFGSHHSDAIITEDKIAKARFTREVDSAAIYVNASTRFTDGGVFGLGAEMGISTEKLHARGPMGLEELCTYKWIAFGAGQIRD